MAGTALERQINQSGVRSCNNTPAILCYLHCQTSVIPYIYVCPARAKASCAVSDVLLAGIDVPEPRDHVLQSLGYMKSPEDSVCHKHGYKREQIADHPGVHYLVVICRLKRVEGVALQDLTPLLLCNNFAAYGYNRVRRWA